MWAESHSAYKTSVSRVFPGIFTLYFLTQGAKNSINEYFRELRICWVVLTIQHKIATLSILKSRRKRRRKHLPLVFFKILSGSHKEFPSFVDISFQIRANFTVEAVWMRGGGGRRPPIGCCLCPKTKNACNLRNNKGFLGAKQFLKNNFSLMVKYL